MILQKALELKFRNSTYNEVVKYNGPNENDHILNWEYPNKFRFGDVYMSVVEVPDEFKIGDLQRIAKASCD